MINKALYSMLVLAAIFMAMVQNFAHFVRNASDIDQPFRQGQSQITGIVVPTGSSGRIEAGFGLMFENYAQRMLITGTGQGVQKPDIRRIIRANINLDQDKATAVMGCCVDLDPAASNTIGNAVETGVWAEEHGLTRLILVTSDFHMPRALELFQETLPSRQIIAYAVPTSWLQIDQMGASRWWSSPRRIQVISREMIKYYANRIRG